MRPIAFLLILSGIMLVEPCWAQPENRTWTSADGNYTTQATFLGYEAKIVRLGKADGSEISVPIESLSYPDRFYVRDQLKAMAESAPATGEASGATASPTDWPRWRGRNLDGICQETGLMAQWPPDGPRLVWIVEGLGTGYASVSITGGKIFTMGRKNGMEHMMALNQQDGSILWSTPLGPGKNQKGSNCTPTVDTDRVYGISIEGDLMCAQVDSGQPVWTKNFGRDFGGRMMSGWGYSESPLVDGNLLICTPGGEQAMLAAMDKSTGRVAWTSPSPQGSGAGYSSMVISNGGGVKQYVQLFGKGIFGVDAANGRPLWFYPRIANGTANIPTPIVDGDFVFTSTGYQTGAALLRLSRNGGSVAAQEQYFLDSNTLQNHHGGMILLDGYVYCGHGHNNGFPICVEMKSGRIAWGGKQRGPGSGSAAVAYADGHLYFRYENGVMALIEATPRAYNLKSSFRLAVNHDRSWPHPVIVDGKMYLRDQNSLMCYDIKAR